MVSPRTLLRLIPGLATPLLLCCSAPALSGCGGSDQAGSVQIKADTKEVAGQLFPVSPNAKKGVSAGDTAAKPKK
jgi:hypothetical protein